MSIKKAQSYDFPSAEFYKLERMEKAFESLGHPQRIHPSVLVAGTNGKGSIVSFLTQLLMQAGFRIGSFFSPHIVRENERILINHQEISDSLLNQLKYDYRSLLSELTYFEQWTLLAALAFRNQHVDYQVYEVGMGGRLDATNLTDPQVSVIGQIGWDHQEVLGDSLYKIAYEKSGIMRRLRPCLVLNPEHDEVRESFCEQARALGSDLRFESEIRLSAQTERWMLGQSQNWPSFQRSNLKLAVAAFLSLHPEKEEELSAYQMRMKLLGRIQIFKNNPAVVLDGAHNLQGCEALARFLTEKFPNTKFHGVFGVMREKQPEKTLKILGEHLKAISLPEYFLERQRPTADLKEITASILPDISVQEIGNNLQETLTDLITSQEPVLVFGSFYLVGEALRGLKGAS